MNKIDWKTLFFLTGKIFFILSIAQTLISWVTFYFTPVQQAQTALNVTIKTK